MSAPDLFTLPHKALRAWLGATATALGGLDTTNLDDRSTLVAQLRVLLSDLAEHGHHEDDFIVPVLDQHVPDLAARLRGEHISLESVIATLGSIVEEFEQSPSPELQLSLYRELRGFEARNLAHLDFEETVIMPALWQAGTADDLIEVFRAFKDAHPDAVELYHRVPNAITPQERAVVFA
jgi:iron-sulfur cluster repair protein YtfE (RIC family)